MNLVRLSDLNSAAIRAIWHLVKVPVETMLIHVACSFEGNGTRTRTTFMRAFRELGFACTELTNFLKTDERPQDLAGYLDPFYDVYVIRESNHARLAEFAQASQRPVINAMSSDGHPCEVLTDAYFIDTSLVAIEKARICLWGPPTNVFQSWHELAEIFGINITHVCDARFHKKAANVTFVESSSSPFDVVVTDSWPKEWDEFARPLTAENLKQLGNPALLPTPPFIIGREFSFDPLQYPGFVGYAQKTLLLPVQRALLCYLLKDSADTNTPTKQAT